MTRPVKEKDSEQGERNSVGGTAGGRCIHWILLERTILVACTIAAASCFLFFSSSREDDPFERR